MLAGMKHEPDVHEAAPRADAGARLIHDAILKRWKALAQNADACRLGQDVEALHDLRVASRRLRAVLRVFAERLPGKRRRRAGKALKKMTRLLGSTREWDVHAETLARLHAGTPREVERAALEHVLELVDVRRGHERAAMQRELEELHVARLERDVRAIAEHVALADGEAGLPALSWQVLQPLAREAFEELPRLRERERPEDLHAMRIACKRLRYALELLEPAFCDGHAKVVTRCKHLQELLGRHHDLHVLEEQLTRTLSRLTEHGRDALAEGLLGPLERLRCERRDQYIEFCGATAMLDTDSFLEEVRRGLRL